MWVAIGWLIVGLVAARITRAHTTFDYDKIPHKSYCRGHRQSKCSTADCLLGRYCKVVFAIPFWPVYGLCWFVLVERLPRPGKGDLRTRTERLRVQNERVMSELDRIEKELELI